MSWNFCSMALNRERSFSPISSMCLLSWFLVQSLIGSELFTEQFLDDDLPIMYCHMKTELAENTKELVYLYR